MIDDKSLRRQMFYQLQPACHDSVMVYWSGAVETLEPIRRSDDAFAFHFNLVRELHDEG